MMIAVEAMLVADAEWLVVVVLLQLQLLLGAAVVVEIASLTDHPKIVDDVGTVVLVIVVVMPFVVFA